MFGIFHLQGIFLLHGSYNYLLYFSVLFSLVYIICKSELTGINERNELASPPVVDKKVPALLYKIGLFS